MRSSTLTMDDIADVKQSNRFDRGKFIDLIRNEIKKYFPSYKKEDNSEKLEEMVDNAIKFIHPSQTLVEAIDNHMRVFSERNTSLEEYVADIISVAYDMGTISES